MKSLYLAISFIIFGLTVNAQSYLGTITKQVNFRAGPGSQYEIIGSLKPNSQVFIISKETEDGFYNVIDISTNKTGYVHKSFVRIDRELEKSDGSFIAPSGSSAGRDTEVEIFNNTSGSMTLKLNSTTYTFSSQEKQTITVTPDTYNFIASAPGVTPLYGSKSLDANRRYTWQFYIVTRRR